MWLASLLLFTFVFSGRCSFVTRSLVIFLCLLLNVLLQNHFFNLFLCVAMAPRAGFAQIFIVSFYFSLCIRVLPSDNLVFCKTCSLNHFRFPHLVPCLLNLVSCDCSSHKLVSLSLKYSFGRLSQVETWCRLQLCDGLLTKLTNGSRCLVHKLNLFRKLSLWRASRKFHIDECSSVETRLSSHLGGIEEGSSCPLDVHKSFGKSPKCFETSVLRFPKLAREQIDDAVLYF